MEENLTQKAIDSALKCEWLIAIKLNTEILKIDSQDIDALNRLACAYFENGNKSKAIATTKIVLSIHPENNIAKKSLVKFSQTKSLVPSQVNKKGLNFIEEAGKTKLTTLLNPGSRDVYACLSSGEEVFLVTHTHKVSVVTRKKEYLGKLTDDISARIRIFTKDGHKYQAFIKSIDKNQIRIFIKGDAMSFPREQLEPRGEFSA